MVAPRQITSCIDSTIMLLFANHGCSSATRASYGSHSRCLWQRWYQILINVAIRKTENIDDTHIDYIHGI